MILPKCVISSSKKSRFIKNQDTEALLSNLGLRKSLSKVPLLGDILLSVQLCWMYKMNEIVNTFLLAGDKFMPAMHLKQPGRTYSACEPFKKKKIQKF